MFGIGIHELSATLFVLCLMVTPGGSLMGQDRQVAEKDRGYFNLAVPTLGGKQFWTDHVWRAGWRIQQNAFTGHWRLLDDRDYRQAWGSRAACQSVLDEKLSIAATQGTVPNSEAAKAPRIIVSSATVSNEHNDQHDANRTHAIVLLHGLMRSSSSMHSLGEHLEKDERYQIIYFSYASSRASISEHAAALSDFVASLPDSWTLSFVGHSMGNIVVRHAIGDWKRNKDEATLKRIRSVVMLGPPNQGAAIARQLAKTGVFGWVTGEGGMELGPNWDELRQRLAVPHCPFGIIAGNLPASIPNNPLVGEASDFVVALEETKLPGATDFLEVPKLHSFLMDAPSVQRAVESFIKEHRF